MGPNNGENEKFITGEKCLLRYFIWLTWYDKLAYNQQHVIFNVAFISRDAFKPLKAKKCN